MRSVWSAVRFLVHLSTASTLTVAFARLSRNVFGAKLINQSLYISTERATSSFQRSGLSRLTIATRPFIAIVSLVVNAEVKGRVAMVNRDKPDLWKDDVARS